MRMVTPVMAKVRPGDASGLRGVLRVASRLVGRGATRVGDGGMRLAEVVVIAVSTGGPAALEVMLPMLPVDFAVPLLIVQHMPKIYTEPLAERLGRLCRMPVRAARGGEPLRAGIVGWRRGMSIWRSRRDGERGQIRFVCTGGRR